MQTQLEVIQMKQLLHHLIYVTNNIMPELAALCNYMYLSSSSPLPIGQCRIWSQHQPSISLQDYENNSNKETMFILFPLMNISYRTKNAGTNVILKPHPSRTRLTFFPISTDKYFFFHLNIWILVCLFFFKRKTRTHTQSTGQALVLGQHDCIICRESHRNKFSHKTGWPCLPTR